MSPSRKFTFDTEFRGPSDVVSDAARARQKKTLTTEEIEAMCAHAQMQGSEAASVRLARSIVPSPIPSTTGASRSSGCATNRRRAASRKSVSEFVLEAALSEAEERLADRSVFTLDAKRWEDFVAALDAPPRRHPRLEQLFREPSVFDAKP